MTDTGPDTSGPDPDPETVEVAILERRPKTDVESEPLKVGESSARRFRIRQALLVEETRDARKLLTLAPRILDKFLADEDIIQRLFDTGLVEITVSDAGRYKLFNWDRMKQELTTLQSAWADNIEITFNEREGFHPKVKFVVKNRPS